MTKIDLGRNQKSLITVFTPIYNRADIIKRLYESLIRQTSFDFEWIIVDDGSTDSIAILVKQWIDSNPPFQIQFIRQKNSGKHSAINQGVQAARGDAFFIVDSDDYLVDNAIQLIENWWKDISDDIEFAGVAGLRANASMEIIGGHPESGNYVDATNLERKKYRLEGDKAEVYKTELLIKYPFPIIKGENFLTENIVWDKIAYEGYKLRWYNQVIYLCEYREDGLTYRGREVFVKNPIGWGLSIKQDRMFGKVDVKSFFLKILDYYSWFRTRFVDEEFMDNLGINREEMNYLKRYVDRTVEEVGKTIAIYGLGSRGKRMIRLFEETQVAVEFVMDRDRADMPYPQIGLSEELREVDAIIVTPKRERDNIMQLLKTKTKNKLVTYEEWLEIIMR